MRIYMQQKQNTSLTNQGEGSAALNSDKHFYLGSTSILPRMC